MMNRPLRNLGSLLVLAMLVSGAGSVAAGEQASDVSGTVTVIATSVATGIGWSQGSWTLTSLDRLQHQFNYRGLGLIAVGIQQTTGVGNVDHLRNLSDFGGKYIKATAEVAVGGGVAATTMLNDKGVVINLTGVAQGVDFRFAVSGIDVTLVK